MHAAACGIMATWIVHEVSQESGRLEATPLQGNRE